MKRSEGFSLIEVMIGILVFTIGILGVVSMQTTSIAANAKAQHTSTGSALASSVLASFRPVDYNALVSPRPPNGASQPPGETGDPAPFYNLNFDVTRLDGDQGPLDGEVALISVDVNWEDYGKSHKTTFYYFKQDELR